MSSQAPRQIKTIVGANIRAARTAASLRQRDLAERIDTDPTSIARWERGAVMPRMETLHVLAEELRVDVGWLVTDHEERMAA